MSIIKIPPYILDSTLDFTFNNVTATGNLVALNANLGNAASANYFVGNGSLLTGLPTYASETFVNNAIANLVDTAPATLNTLNELAAALGNDANFASNVTTLIGSKLSTSAFSTTANTWISTQTTSNLSEGTNLYFTDSRANTAITNKVTKTYVDALGVVAATVTTNAQPNITSVGVLSGLTVTGLLTATGTGIKAGNIIDSSGTIAITTKHNNVPGAIGISSDLTVDGKSYLGDVGNVSILGGTADFVLSTDGTGNLSWVEQTGGSGGGATTLNGLTDVTINAPTDNQVLSYDSANTIWVNKTVSSSSGGGVVFTNSTTAPSTPAEGDQWFDPTTGTTYTYISDGTSNQWVEFGTAGASSSGSSSGASTGKAFAMSLLFGG